MCNSTSDLLDLITKVLEHKGNVTTRTKDRTKLVSYIECDTNKSPRQHVKSPWGLLLFGAYLPIQKNPRRARLGNLPADVQIIQRTGVGVADVLINPAFV